jgi:hypothetical protein
MKTSALAAASAAAATSHHRHTHTPRGKRSCGSRSARLTWSARVSLRISSATLTAMTTLQGKQASASNKTPVKTATPRLIQTGFPRLIPEGGTVHGAEQGDQDPLHSAAGIQVAAAA